MELLWPCCGNIFVCCTLLLCFPNTFHGQLDSDADSSILPPMAEELGLTWHSPDPVVQGDLPRRKTRVLLSDEEEEEVGRIPVRVGARNRVLLSDSDEEDGKNIVRGDGKKGTVRKTGLSSGRRNRILMSDSESEGESEPDSQSDGDMFVHFQAPLGVRQVEEEEEEEEDSQYGDWEYSMTGEEWVPLEKECDSSVLMGEGHGLISSDSDSTEEEEESEDENGMEEETGLLSLQFPVR